MIKIKKHAAVLFMAISLSGVAYAQQKESVYGDAVKADVKLNYVYTLEDAVTQSRLQKKPIFFNCFADWAMPCHSMNQLVFSDKEIGDFMNKNFVNLFMDLSEKKNKSIAKRYKVSSFAHYLVLDADGNILLRISGGMPKDDFKKAVSRALNPKTTLPGSEKIYNSGKRGKKELLNYLNALSLAGKDSLFKIVNKQYMDILSKKEYSRPENWLSVTSSVDDRENPIFKYIIDNKKEFCKNNGEAKVNGFIERYYFNDALNVAMGKTEYDPMAMADLFIQLQKVGLPDSCSTYRVLEIARLRGEKNYTALLDYLTENEKRLDIIKAYIDTSLDIPEEDLNKELRERLIAYFSDIAKRAGNSGYGIQMRTMIHQLQNKTKGINFEEMTLSEAMDKAKQEGKVIFVDCYTTWCGPCRKMAATTFVNAKVTEEFNNRFVNLKIDMEKGEGPELMKRFEITAFPTLLFLNSNGEILEKNVGGLNPDGLLEFASKIK